MYLHVFDFDFDFDCDNSGASHRNALQRHEKSRSSVTVRMLAPLPEHFPFSKSLAQHEEWKASDYEVVFCQLTTGAPCQKLLAGILHVPKRARVRSIIRNTQENREEQVLFPS